MVEVREVAILAAHAAAAVEKEDDLLIALVLVFAGDRRALASCGLPVDLAQRVAVAEFPQLVEFQAQATTRPLTHTELAEPVVHRLQLGAVEAGEVRVDAGLAGQVECAPLIPQPQRAGQGHLAGGEVEVAARARAHPVAELGALAGMQRHPLRQGLELHGGRYLVEHPGFQRTFVRMVQGQPYLAPAPQGQVAWQLALQARRALAAQPEGVEQGEQDQGAEQAPPERAELRRQADAQCRQGAEQQGQAEEPGP
ncbi:hypothetical protein D9M68_714990 [compost metagenome]